MAQLEFKGKSAVYSHHSSAPYRPLIIDQKKSYSKGSRPNLDDNLIIHGDNLEALKSLLPRYTGKIKLVYIDPPYNTGNENWVYNDNVNNPLIQSWLRKVVDKDDLEKHDKWLCMMWPRLQLLKELMQEDGVICVSIDDNEMASLKLILDEVFGSFNFVSQLIWRSGGTAASHFANEHEYIIVYAKNRRMLPLFSYIGDDQISDRAIKKHSSKNPLSSITFPPGIDFDAPDQKFPKLIGGKESVKVIKGILESRNGKLANEVTLEAAWAMKDMIERWLRGDRPIYDQKGQEILRFFFKENGVLQYEKKRGTVHPSTIIDGMTTKQGSTELLQILGSSIFDFPKPSTLIKVLIQYITKPDAHDLILDSFAGSGTTAHAVLAANQEDGGNRKFILIECEDYADKITAERVRRVIKGVPSAKDERLKQGMGGLFTFCTLGEPVEMEALLKGKHLPSYDELAKYVFFNATGQTLHKIQKKNSDYLIGETDQHLIHLVYEPDIKFLRSKEAALTERLAEKIGKSKQGNKTSLVFAANKFLHSKELRRHGIEYCQLPYVLYKLLG